MLDNAGWHSPKGLVVPDGITLVFLPAYSPELQPAERLWPLLDEAVANKHFPPWPTSMPASPNAALAATQA